jgi:hypothetical protein
MNFPRILVLASGAIAASLPFGYFSHYSPVAYGAQQECSVAKLQGRYVFSGHGANLHYGVFDFDGAGRFQAGKPHCAITSPNAKSRRAPTLWTPTALEQ